MVYTLLRLSRAAAVGSGDLWTRAVERQITSDDGDDSSRTLLREIRYRQRWVSLTTLLSDRAIRQSSRITNGKGMRGEKNAPSKQRGAANGFASGESTSEPLQEG
jgi:hypothetical protein